MAKSLKNLVIRAVGLVDKGANQEAKMALVKRAEPTEGTQGTGAQRLIIKFTDKGRTDG